VLDGPIWAAANGAQAHFARVHGQAAMFHPAVSPVATLRPGHDERAWADLAALAGPGARIGLAGVTAAPPPDWDVEYTIPGVQMVATRAGAASHVDAAPLGPGDVPDMLELAARAGFDAFPERALDLGTYLGVRRGGRLVAMAGERARPPGWTEISGVCTDPAHRGQGLAGRVVRALAAGIEGRGETAFLHASAANTTAIRLYESLGFTLRRTTTFHRLRVP